VKKRLFFGVIIMDLCIAGEEGKWVDQETAEIVVEEVAEAEEAKGEEDGRARRAARGQQQVGQQ
jgi:hypothetical protein